MDLDWLAIESTEPFARMCVRAPGQCWSQHEMIAFVLRFHLILATPRSTAELRIRSNFAKSFLEAGI